MEKTKLEQDTATLAAMGYRIKDVGEPVYDDDWMTSKEYVGSRPPIGVTRGNNDGFCVQHDQSNYYLEKIPVPEVTDWKAIAKQYRKKWLSLQNAIGQNCLNKALEWVKSAKERESAATTTIATDPICADCSQSVPFGQPCPRCNEMVAVPPVFQVGDVVVYKDGRMFQFVTMNEVMLSGVSADDKAWVVPISECRLATPAEKRKFFALNPTKHPMHCCNIEVTGKRYLEIDEIINESDMFFDGSPTTLFIGKRVEGGQTFLRRVDSEGNDIDQAAYEEINERHGIEVVRPDIKDDVITKEGVWRRRDGRIVKVLWCSIYWRAGSIAVDNHGRHSDECETKHDIITYLAPLPPNGAKLLGVKPGDKLPDKFWFCYLNQGYSQWLTWGVKASEKERDTAHLNFLYAEYIEPTPIIPEGFTPWAGGECPVDGDVKVEIATNEDCYLTDTADTFMWEWDAETNIIAYRIIPPAPWVPTPQTWVKYYEYKLWFIGIDHVNRLWLCDNEGGYAIASISELSPWIDPPHFSTVVDAGFGKCMVEWTEGQEPVVTKAEVQS